MGIDNTPDTFTHGQIMAERQKEYERYLLEKESKKEEQQKQREDKAAGRDAR